MINSSIFKSYDIRGIYPTDLDEKTAFAVGRAFVKHTNAKNIVVAYDARLSSPLLFYALCKGILAQGARVISIGQVPTECLYFAVFNYDFDAGIMITASHNPKEYNGFKMIKRKGNDILWIRGKDLFSVVKGEKFDDKEIVKIPEKNVLEDHANYVLSFFDLTSIKRFKVVVDASNGVIGKVIEGIEKKLSIEIIKLNFEPNGNFPNHSPNPLEEGSSNQISRAIKEQKADFGIMFDGDADRIFLIDENGQLIKGDISISILAKHILNKHPGAAIIYNAICSKSVPEFVKKWGGKPVRTPVGFVNVREGLIKEKGFMGGEVSAHYCFKDYFYMDSGLMAFLTFLQSLSQDGRNVSEVAKELTIYLLEELNFEIKDKDKEAVLEKIKEKYSDGKQDFLDGVTVEYKDWWFNVRPSNTEPLLRLTIEADTQDLLESKKQELSKFISNLKS